MGFAPTPAQGRTRGPAKTLVYRAIRWYEYLWERLTPAERVEVKRRLEAQTGRVLRVSPNNPKVPAPVMAILLLGHANFLDHGWRRRDDEARLDGPSPLDELTARRFQLVEAREGKLTLGELVPQAQIDAEADQELEEAILRVKPRTGRERRAVDDLRQVHALAWKRDRITLEDRRERAVFRFRSRYKRDPTEPSAWQRREAERFIKRRHKRERKEAKAFRDALGKLAKQTPEAQAATIRDWRRMNPEPPNRRELTDYEVELWKAAEEAARESYAPDTGRSLQRRRT